MRNRLIVKFGAILALGVTLLPSAAVAQGRRSAAPQIPAAFQGDWDFARPCNADSDMQMHVRPREIGFYEDSATLRNVTVNSPTQVTLVVDMHIAGDEESSRQTMTLTLRDNGQRMTTQFGGRDSDPQERVRCGRAAH